VRISVVVTVAVPAARPADALVVKGADESSRAVNGPYGLLACGVRTTIFPVAEPASISAWACRISPS
jgi:hypothetical protein